jgi:predicted nuclease of predicted toxin-antitoxin system
LSLKLLIDEDSQAKKLVKLLLRNGHDVITVNEANLSGQPDEIVFNYAQEQKRLLLTRNYDDFLAIHKANPDHSGIIVIYESDNLLKDMTFKTIVNMLEKIVIILTIPLAQEKSAF